MNGETKRASHYYRGIKYPNGKDQAAKSRLRWKNTDMKSGESLWSKNNLR